MNTQLTGSTRYRAEKRFMRAEPLLVLQVEVLRHGVYRSTDPEDVPAFAVNQTYWRDATVSDLAALTEVER